MGRFLDPDAFDPADHLDEDDLDAEARPPVHCRSCGSTEVRWRQQTGRWVLFSLRPGVEHRCDATDDFEAV